MMAFVLRRLAWMIALLWLLATATFFLIRLAPGGPFDAERKLTKEIEANLRRAYRLDQPLHLQYWHWLSNAARGDLGPSMSYRNHRVNDILAQALPVSISLGLTALLLALALGLAAGVVGAARHNTAWDHLTMGVALIGISIPSFVLALLLVLGLVFAVPLFSPAGWGRPDHLVLPGLALALPYAGRFARLVRTGLLDVLREDWIRTARAKGLSEPAVVLRHALWPSLLPVVSYLGPASAGILTGSLVVEKIFAIPGLGRHFVKSAFDRDYTLVMGTVLLYFVLLAAFNLLVDLAYGWLDPRLRHDRR